MTTYASSDTHSLGSGPGRGPFTYSCPFGCDLGAPGCNIEMATKVIEAEVVDLGVILGGRK